MTRKQTNVLLIFICLIIVIPLVWWGVSSMFTVNNSSETLITDRDTGETFAPEDINFETGGSIAKQSSIQLFGIENFSKVAREANTDTGGYLVALKEALWNFSKERLNDEFSTLTVRPQDLKVSASSFSGYIRIGQTDTIIPIKGTITPARETAIVTINESGKEYDGSYIYVGGVRNPDQLLFSITQKDSSSTDLVIDAIPGYTEPALKYIESLGYNVPDFSITFTDVTGAF